MTGVAFYHSSVVKVLQTSGLDFTSITYACQGSLETQLPMSIAMLDIGHWTNLVLQRSLTHRRLIQLLVICLIKARSPLDKFRVLL